MGASAPFYFYMNWDIIFTVIIVGTVLFFYQFGQDIMEKTKWFKRNQAKGEDRWKWATTPPYFTFKKIIYWIIVAIVLTITLYLGFKIETEF